jgi:hypothetical protein
MDARPRRIALYIMAGEDLARLMSELEAGSEETPAHTRHLLLSMGRTFVSGGRV